MTCNLERPSAQDLFDRYLNMFSNTVLGGAAVIPESNEWYATSLNYAMAEEFYAISEQAWKERDPRAACCENLIDMASVDGIVPFPALEAQGFVELTGTAGTALPTPLEFTIGGLNFITASEDGQPVAIGDDGTATIRVRALTAGAAGNIAEETGTMNTVVGGVVSEVKVCGGTFCNGADAEDCDTFRARYLRRLSYQPRATNAWALEKLLEWPCATRAVQRGGSCCQCGGCEGGDCGCAECGGELAFYVLFDNTFDNGVAPASAIQEIEDWMFGSPQGYGLGQMEIGICGRIIPVTCVPVDVVVDIADCITQTQLTQINQQIAEFFTTIGPSQTIYGRVFETTVANIIGAATNFEVQFNLVNDEDSANVNRFGCCELEPKCDYMLCLNEVQVISGGTEGSCS